MQDHFHQYSHIGKNNTSKFVDAPKFRSIDISEPQFFNVRRSVNTTKNGANTTILGFEDQSMRSSDINSGFHGRLKYMQKLFNVTHKRKFNETL